MLQDHTGVTSLCFLLQVMETDRMIYLVTEYASGGEIFGKLPRYVTLWQSFCLQS